MPKPRKSHQIMLSLKDLELELSAKIYADIDKPWRVTHYRSLLQKITEAREVAERVAEKDVPWEGQ